MDGSIPTEEACPRFILYTVWQQLAVPDEFQNDPFEWKIASTFCLHNTTPTNTIFQWYFRILFGSYLNKVNELHAILDV